MQAGWEGGLVDTILLKFRQLKSVIKIDKEGENLEVEKLEFFSFLTAELLFKTFKLNNNAFVESAAGIYPFK